MNRTTTNTIHQNLIFDYDLEYLYNKQIQRNPTDTHIKSTNHGTKQHSKKAVSRELEHIIRLNGVDYVWIYRMIKPESIDNTDTLSE